MAYIDREKAKELITNYGKGAILDGLKTLDPVDDIIMLAKGVDLIPTADVAEVKHGEWIVHQNGEYWHYDCPFCNDGFATKGKDLTPPNYCGNCGTRMDGTPQKEVKNG